MSTLESELNKRPQVDAYFIFEARPGVDQEATEKAGHAVYKDEHWVKMKPKGDNQSETNFKVSLLPRSRPWLWDVIRPAYEAWKNGQEEPLSGIPLKGWSGCTEAQRLSLANFNIKTVEDLAEASDGVREKIPGFSRLQKVAKNYINGIGENSRLAEQNASLQEELKEKGEMLASAQKDIEDLKSQVAALLKAKAA